jgi:hypothetical protein
MRTAKFSSD